MNKTGGGITSYTTFTSSEMRLFNGGLRNLPQKADRLEINKHETFADHHDFLNYERGSITRTRSPFTQYLLYQQFFGGAKTYAYRWGYIWGV